MAHAPEGWTKTKEGVFYHTEKSRASGYNKSRMGTPKGTTDYMKTKSMGLYKADDSENTSGKPIHKMDKGERSPDGYVATYSYGHDNIHQTYTVYIMRADTKKGIKELAQEFMESNPKPKFIPEWVQGMMRPYSMEHWELDPDLFAGYRELKDKSNMVHFQTEPLMYRALKQTHEVTGGGKTTVENQDNLEEIIFRFDIAVKQVV